MSDIIITNEQLDRISDQLKREKAIQSIKENWAKCNKEQRLFVLEYLKVLHPEKSQEIQKLIKETKSETLNEEWYNNVLGFIGWLDPTGIADTLNGVLYMSQGDYLFGFLSLVSAVPYIGDVVAKPVMGALKVGAPSAKALNNVMALSKAGKTAEASAELAKLSSQGGLVSKFVSGIGKIGNKLEDLINAMPGSKLKGFKNTILEWIRLFKGGAKTGVQARTALGTLAKNMPKMSAADQVKNLEMMKKALVADRSFIGKFMGPRGAFSGYRTAGSGATWKTPWKIFTWKNFWGGMPQLMSRNKSVRALMRKTKWYLGLLDFLGIGNFVGPDELQQKLGDAKYEQSISDYNQSAQAQQYIQDDFGNQGLDDSQQVPTTTSNTSNQQSTQTQMDPLSWLMGSLVSK